MENGNSESSMQDMDFSTNAPITMPMIDGYYNGEKVYFIHTEVSDSDMAEMMSMMVNFSTLHVPELTSIPEEETAHVYVFTNGIAGSGPYGGGPFFFQIDIFDTIPGDEGYSQFRIPYLVTWNENSSPRILTSVVDIFEAGTNGELKIVETNLVVNAPMIVWTSDGMEQQSSMVERVFESMPGIDGEIITVDVENYLVTLKLHQRNVMDIMK